MKTIDMAKAQTVIGGAACDTCVVDYHSIMVDGSGLSCGEFTTCTDKQGNQTVAIKQVDSELCGPAAETGN